MPRKGLFVNSDHFPPGQPIPAAPPPHTYNVSGELPGFTIGILRDAVSQAFALWAEETPLAFVEAFSNPGITITFRPLGVNSGLGNALIEINSSMSFRYGDTQSQPTNTYDLVTVLAHEIGHRLGLDHNTDPSSIMFESVGNSKTIRTLPAVDIQAIRSLDGPPDIVEATGVHGTSVIIENPQQISSTLRLRNIHDRIRRKKRKGRTDRCQSERQQSSSARRSRRDCSKSPSAIEVSSR